MDELCLRDDLGPLPLQPKRAVKPTFALHRVADYLHRPFNTLDGLLESPVVRSTGTVNPTYNGALLSLVLQLRLRERTIVAHILGKG